MGKCKYCKKCPLYDEDGLTCNKNKGMYYDDGIGLRTAGCYGKMEEENEE